MFIIEKARKVIEKFTDKHNKKEIQKNKTAAVAKSDRPLSVSPSSKPPVRKKKGEYIKIEKKSMPLKNIKICKRFTPPNTNKYLSRLVFYKENGFTKSRIHVDEKGFLQDGYISYLILTMNGVKTCEVDIVRFCEYNDGN